MTLTEFRALHGDPSNWSGVEVEEYLSVCDQVEATQALRPDLDAAHVLVGGLTRSGKGGAA
ncbi:hypothetical protein [Streptomyces sp. NPDC050255]|uniref:hypothetical protein n=1 Tax=Streptomyces sp. NPDC050255 TaxID=3365606 RepID=UPI00378BEF92